MTILLNELIEALKTARDNPPAHEPTFSDFSTNEYDDFIQGREYGFNEAIEILEKRKEKINSEVEKRHASEPLYGYLDSTKRI